MVQYCQMAMTSKLRLTCLVIVLDRKLQKQVRHGLLVTIKVKLQRITINGNQAVIALQIHLCLTLQLKICSKVLNLDLKTTIVKRCILFLKNLNFIYIIILLGKQEKYGMVMITTVKSLQIC